MKCWPNCGSKIGLGSYTPSWTLKNASGTCSTKNRLKKLNSLSGLQYHGKWASSSLSGIDSRGPDCPRFTMSQVIRWMVEHHCFPRWLRSRQQRFSDVDQGLFLDLVLDLSLSQPLSQRTFLLNGLVLPVLNVVLLFIYLLLNNLHNDPHSNPNRSSMVFIHHNDCLKESLLKNNDCLRSLYWKIMTPFFLRKKGNEGAQKPQDVGSSLPFLRPWSESAAVFNWRTKNKQRETPVNIWSHVTEKCSYQHLVFSKRHRTKTGACTTENDEERLCLPRRRDHEIRTFLTWRILVGV